MIRPNLITQSCGGIVTSIYTIPGKYAYWGHNILPV